MGETPSALGEDFSVVNPKQIQNPNNGNPKLLRHPLTGTPQTQGGLPTRALLLFQEFVFWTLDIVSDSGFRA